MIDAIATRVRIGVFPHIAAAACRVPKTSFYRWMALGKDGKGGVYRELWNKVSEAGAQARVLAECQVFRDDPATWLRLGPGRGDWTEQHHVCVEVNPSSKPQEQPVESGPSLEEGYRKLVELGLLVEQSN